MFSKRIKPFFQGGIRNLLMIFAVVGIAAAMYGFKYDRSVMLLGIIILLICLGAYSGYYGIQIDYNHQRYLNYFSFIGIKSGRWKPLPLIGKIVITPRKRYFRASSRHSNIYEEIFLIKLVPAEKDESIIASIGLYHDLALEADTLSKELGVPVVEDFK